MGSGALPPEEMIASAGAPDGLDEDLSLVVKDDTASKAGWALIAMAHSWK